MQINRRLKTYKVVNERVVKVNMIFIKVSLLLQLLVEVAIVVSYTVVLKPVKPLYPVKVYRYELRQPKIITDNQYYYKTLPGTRLYPVVVKPQNTRTRVTPKKEKRKFSLKPPTTEKPVVRDQRLYGLPQQLVPPVSNQIEEYSENKEEETREPENDIRHLLTSPPYEDKSFSSFGQEKGRIYNRPGEWATTAAPIVDSDNTTQSTFTPSQLYLQIRHKNTVIHVPQTEALKDAETLEELINAPRLKELARTTHVQEVYSEEGYEDAGYDHAGHIRHAQHGEVYDAKDKGKFHIKQPPVILDYDSDLEESQKTPKNISVENNLGEDDKTELRRIRSRTEKTKLPVEHTKAFPGYKGDRKYSSRVKAPLNYEEGNSNASGQTLHPTFPSHFEELPPAPINILANDSFAPKLSSKYNKEEFNSTKIYPVGVTPPLLTAETKPYTDFKPYLSQIDSQASPSAKSLKYSRIYSKKTKQLRLEPYKTGEILVPPPEDLQPPPPETVQQESINERIVLPTIGYINSLTTAHFGKGNSAPVKEEPKTRLTTALNLTEALNYLRSTKSPKIQEPTETPGIIDIRTFEPMKLKPLQKTHKTKRDVYLVRERDRRETSDEDYEGNGEGDEPHNEKNAEIAEDERKRIEEENREKEEYEKELREEISKKEKEILKETYKNIGVEEDISEVFPELPASDFEADPDSSSSEVAEDPVDPVKYPFYFSRRLPENSALRYATDPRKFPRKSGYKMEFYDSRDDYIQCPDFHPDLDDLPNSNSTEYSDEQAGDNQRLAGVGDKIMCLRMKYFDRDPFDNPIFKEKEIDYVGKSKKHFSKVKSSQTKVEPKRVKVKDSIASANEKKKVRVTVKPNNKKLTRIPIKMLRPSNSTIKKAQSLIVPKPKPVKIETSQNRIIPVTEVLNEATSSPRPHTTSYFPRQKSAYVPGYHKPISTNKIVISNNCMQNISELAAIDGKKNVIVECKDATLVQELLNGVAYLRIIPKEIKPQKTSQAIWKDEYKGDQTDWVPIIGYNVRRPIASRKTDEVKLVKNATDSNFDMYVIDELKEDENVRKGEVVEDMVHYLEMMKNITKSTQEPATVKNETKTKNETREKREAQADPIKKKFTLKRPNVDFDLIEKVTQKETPKPEPLEPDTTYRPFTQKRTLARLSGSDFLTRYHKNKAKPLPQGKTADFWKISTPPSAVNSLKKNSAVVTTTNSPKKTLQPTTIDPPARTTKPEIRDSPKVAIRINNYKPEPSRSTRPSEPKVDNRKFDKEPSKPTEFKKPEISEIREPPRATAREYRLETKQTNDFRKNTPQNVEKEYKQPETKQTYEFRTTSNPIKQENITKIITSVSKVVTESNEQPPILQIKEEKFARLPEPKQEPQYKTINRNKKENSEESGQYIESTDGPTLYYVVDTKTGLGKWITDYEERKRRKFRKVRKLNRRPKTEKKVKKQRK